MSGIEHILALDGGGSKTAAALLDPAGQTVATVTVGACNLHQDPEGGVAEVERAWQALGGAADLDPAATCISAGLAGVSNPAGRARFITAFARFGALRLSGDGYIALLGAFEGAPGALLSIGTGVVAYRLRADGSCRQLSGWGFPAGDRGGGAWLGWRLVADWLEALDGHAAAPPPPLLARAAEHLLGSDRDAVVGRLRTILPGDLAGLARPMLDHAGEPYVAALLDEATTHHLRLATALDPTPAEPLVLGGGLAPTFARRLAAALPPGCLAADRVPAPLRGAWLVGIGRTAPEYPSPTGSPA